MSYVYFSFFFSPPLFSGYRAASEEKVKTKWSWNEQNATHIRMNTFSFNLIIGRFNLQCDGQSDDFMVKSRVLSALMLAEKLLVY